MLQCWTCNDVDSGHLLFGKLTIVCIPVDSALMLPVSVVEALH